MLINLCADSVLGHANLPPGQVRAKKKETNSVLYNFAASLRFELEAYHIFYAL